MREFLEGALFPVIGPPHGDGLCWAGRIMSLGWVLFLAFSLVLGLAGGGIQNPFVVLPLIGMVVALAGLRWHLVPAILLTSVGVCYLGALLLHDPVQFQPAALLFAAAVTTGGIVNALAWLSERSPSKCPAGWRHLEIVVALVCGLPGLALFVSSLWSYSGLGDDCEWGQDTMMGGLAMLGAIVGAVLFLVALFGGMSIFRRVSREWQEDKK